MTTNKNNLGTTPIGQLLFKLSTPAMFGLIIIMTYNIVDTIFVGQFAGSRGLAGMSVVLPIMFLVPVFGLAIGIGAGSIISRALGAGDHQRANQVFGNAIGLTFLITGSLAILGYIFGDTMLFIFGARGEITQEVWPYYIYILAGIPFHAMKMCLNNILRAEGNARFPMYAQLISALINILLDYIFIVQLHMGLMGAGFATLLAHVVGLAYITSFFLRGKSSLKLKITNLIPQKAIITETLGLGASTLGRQGAASFIAIAANHTLFRYGGEQSVAVYGIINRLYMVLSAPINGLVQGFMPIAGFNFGARQFDRVRKVILTALTAGFLINFITFAIARLFSNELSSMFTNNVTVAHSAATALIIITLTWLTHPIQLIGSSYLQAVGKAKPAFLLTISRQILFLIPMILFLPNLMGEEGVWYAFVIADILTFIVSVILLIPEWKKVNYEEQEMKLIPG
ncbi:MATE family efflux transporter [Marinilabiliaceae bacterium JC017]|nr:MATE family efflux transporter [Marinilabiliaceae bacterium JC017]